MRYNYHRALRQDPNSPDYQPPDPLRLATTIGAMAAALVAVWLAEQHGSEAVFMGPFWFSVVVTTICGGTAGYLATVVPVKNRHQLRQRLGNQDIIAVFEPVANQLTPEVVDPHAAHPVPALRTARKLDRDPTPSIAALLAHAVALHRAAWIPPSDDEHRRLRPWLMPSLATAIREMTERAGPWTSLAHGMPEVVDHRADAKLRQISLRMRTIRQHADGHYDASIETWTFRRHVLASDPPYQHDEALGCPHCGAALVLSPPPEFACAGCRIPLVGSQDLWEAWDATWQIARPVEPPVAPANIERAAEIRVEHIAYLSALTTAAPWLDIAALEARVRAAFAAWVQAVQSFSPAALAPFADRIVIESLHHDLLRGQLTQHTTILEDVTLAGVTAFEHVREPERLIVRLRTSGTWKYAIYDPMGNLTSGADTGTRPFVQEWTVTTPVTAHPPEAIRVVHIHERGANDPFH